jgi:NAD(P)-dependent dehydrogenase (short-subunit alcohol dehydrogenase family)
MQASALIRSAFDETTTAGDVARGVDLGGKVALVTGGAAGIGREIVRALAQAGAEVLIGDVDATACDEAIADIRAGHAHARVSGARLDLGDLASVRDFAGSVLDARPKLDILVNNAGIMAPPLGYTRSGHELQFGINYLGHYALVTALLPALAKAPAARVVSVSSIGHRRSDVNFDDIDYRTRPYDRWEAYGQSKTACALLAVAITETQREHDITANAVNPGGSMTGLQRYLSPEELRAQGWLDEQGNVPARWRSPAQCAATSVWAATGAELAGVGGLYLENCRQAEPWQREKPMQGVMPHALAHDNALRLWELSRNMVAS